MESSSADDKRVMDLVSTALRRPAAEREAYLQLACANDQNLYQETVAAVRGEERMGSFLQRPMVDFKQFARPFQVGQVVSERFEILREIGEGGMGVVYEALDRKRNKRIAIKAAKPGFQRLLSPELEGALKVRHPNICLVNEIHTARTGEDEIDFLTMELLEGETLSAHLSAKGKLDPEEALAIARQLCAGLAEAHSSGVIHHDLKSANVILCPTANGKSRAVITDFGLAGIALQAGEIAGTPGYMPPELWRGEKGSKASDIFSLGVVLYEILTGRLPFEKKSDQRSPDRRPPDPSTLVPHLNRRWDRVIRQCLRPTPAGRPADAGRVIDGLERKLLRKETLLVSALAASVVLAVGSQVPQIHDKLVELFWPPPPNVRLAILPFDGLPDDNKAVGGVLQDVSDRIRHLRSGRNTVVVIPPSEAVNQNVQSPEQARQVLHATHALQTTVRRQGDEYVAEGSVVDLGARVHLRDFSGHYSSATVGTMPEALAGEISLALRLQGAARESISPAATTAYDHGLYLLRRDSLSFDEATSQFEEAARLDPRSPLPLAGLVEAAIMKFQATKQPNCMEEAQRWLGAAESLNPDSARVRLAAGLLNETQSHYEKALEDYRRVQDLEPRNVDAFLRIAGIYDKLDMPDKAIAAFQNAIALDPGYYLPYEYLGEFYYYRGKYPDAIEMFTKTIDRDPGMYDAYTNRAAALDNLGRDDEAKRDLAKSLQLRETARALNSMGAILAFQKQDAQAVGYYERAVALDPRTYVYFLNLADSDRRLGRRTKARAAYQEAMNLARAALIEDPARGYTRAFVAYFAAQLGDPKRAGEEIEQALQLSPGDSEVVRCAVLTYVALGQPNKAFEVLNRANPELVRELERHPDLAEFRQDSRFQELVVRNLKGAN